MCLVFFFVLVSLIFIFVQFCLQFMFLGVFVVGGFVDGVYVVFVEDFDGDGDMDVFLVFFNDNKIVWYENFGGGNFGLQQVIFIIMNGMFFVYVVDLDGDGDVDVFFVFGYDDKVVWYENLGGGSFGLQ